MKEEIKETKKIEKPMEKKSETNQDIVKDTNKNKGNSQNNKESNTSKNSESSKDVLTDTKREVSGDKTVNRNEQIDSFKEGEKLKREFKRKEKQERIGILNIYTTFNNTMINLTDMSGKSIAKFSGGQSTKQDRLKANPTIAMFISQRIAEESRDNGITGFYVKVRAKTRQANPGPGTHAAIKSLTRAGFRILSIMDTTRIPRGGPKKKGGRRGRRV